MAGTSGGKRGTRFSRNNLRKTIRSTLHMPPHPDDVKEGVKETPHDDPHYILQTVRQAINLGNIWRFPYVAEHYGGGTFALACLISALLIRDPLCYMELLLGQIVKKGPVHVHRSTIRLFRGLGMAMCWTSFVNAIYHNIIVTYTLHYLYHSIDRKLRINGTLPYLTCKSQSWSSGNTCVEGETLKNWAKLGYWNYNKSYCGKEKEHGTGLEPSYGPNPGHSCQGLGYHKEVYVNESYPRYATEDFWFKHVLDWSEDVQYFGRFDPKLVATFTIAWVIVFIYFSKFFTYFRKVVYFTPSFPYLILVACLTGSLSLQGSKEGIDKFLSVDVKKFKEVKIWRDAVTQVFFSTAVGSGSMHIFGQHHCSRKTVKKQVFLLSFLDCATSFIAGLVTFSALGHLKFILNAPHLKNAARGGAGLIFITYPVAFEALPTTEFWGVCFFFVLFLLGLDCQFELLETLVVSLQDHFSSLTKRHTVIWGCLCIGCFLAGLPLMMQNGYYFLDILDVHGGAFPLLFLAMMQTIAVAYIYGVNKFGRLIKQRLEIRISSYWKVLWVISPLIFGLLLFMTIYEGKPLMHLQGYHYPDWAVGFGWTISAIPIVIFVVSGVGVISHRLNRNKELPRWKRLTTGIRWSLQPSKAMELDERKKEEENEPPHGSNHSAPRDDHDQRRNKKRFPLALPSKPKFIASILKGGGSGDDGDGDGERGGGGGGADENEGGRPSSRGGPTPWIALSTLANNDDGNDDVDGAGNDLSVSGRQPHVYVNCD